MTFGSWGGSSGHAWRADLGVERLEHARLHPRDSECQPHLPARPIESGSGSGSSSNKADDAATVVDMEGARAVRGQEVSVHDGSASACHGDSDSEHRGEWGDAGQGR